MTSALISVGTHVRESSSPLINRATATLGRRFGCPKDKNQSIYAQSKYYRDSYLDKLYAQRFWCYSRKRQPTSRRRAWSYRMPRRTWLRSVLDTLDQWGRPIALLPPRQYLVSCAEKTGGSRGSLLVGRETMHRLRQCLPRQLPSRLIAPCCMCPSPADFPLLDPSV